MKDLIIPTRDDKSLDLAVITSDFKGIIIGYKYNDAVGYIQYGDYMWYFMTDIDSENNFYNEDNLLDLLDDLIKNHICSHFKVLEFSK